MNARLICIAALIGMMSVVVMCADSGPITRDVATHVALWRSDSIAQQDAAIDWFAEHITRGVPKTDVERWLGIGMKGTDGWCFYMPAYLKAPSDRATRRGLMIRYIGFPLAVERKPQIHDPGATAQTQPATQAVTQPAASMRAGTPEIE